MLEEIENYLNTIWNYILWFYDKYKILSWIIISIIIVFFLTRFFSALIFDVTNIKNGCVFLFKALKKLILLPFKLIKYFIKGIIWIFNIKSRIEYKRYLKQCVFNVKQDYKIPLKYKLFSFKIRKQENFRLKCIESCINTEEQINKNFKFIIMLEASIGGGKTSFLNGFSHMKTLSLTKKIDDDLYEIEKKLYEINYYKLRKEIDRFYSIGCSEEEIKEKILEIKDFKNKFNKSFDDCVSNIPKLSLLEAYIKAFSAKLRNNYVMCNYKLFNRITNTYNYALESDAFDIKDKNSQKKFFIPPYLVVVDDEKALSEFKNTESAKELDKKGTDIIMRLFRQLQRETTYYISSTQNTSRIALLLRELANTYVLIEKFSIVGEQNCLANKYRIKEEKLFNKMIKYSNKKFKHDEYKQEKYLLNNNKFKQEIFDLFKKQRQLYSSGFISYTVRVANKLDYLNDEDKSKQLKLTFPLTWCFGVYNTCEFSEFNDYLLSLSEIKSDSQLKQISSLYEKDETRFEKLLQEKIKEDKKGKTKNEEK